MSTTKQKLPDWFNGELYEEGDVVENPYSGESIELNNIELSMYDFIMGTTIVMEMGLDTDIVNLKKGLNWFRQHNAKAYMVLLD